VDVDLPGDQTHAGATRGVNQRRALERRALRHRCGRPPGQVGAPPGGGRLPPAVLPAPSYRIRLAQQSQDTGMTGKGSNAVSLTSTPGRLLHHGFGVRLAHGGGMPAEVLAVRPPRAARKHRRGLLPLRDLVPGAVSGILRDSALRAPGRDHGIPDPGRHRSRPVDIPLPRARYQVAGLPPAEIHCGRRAGSPTFRWCERERRRERAGILQRHHAASGGHGERGGPLLAGFLAATDGRPAPCST
jgi:hypothetical protein